MEETGAKTQETAYSRRYVSMRETVAYLFNDVSNSFNIEGYKNRFIWDVVNIDFQVQAVAGVFTGAWDLINDSVIGVMVDKTRTRWGKFRPYLVGFQMPMTLLGALYWILPLFFPNTSGTFLPKLICYFTAEVLKETAGTFNTIAKAGYATTITPNPDERGRLILLAELLTGYMGEDLPAIAMGVLIDLVNNHVVRWKLSGVFVAMGGGAAVVSAAFTLYFALISRERVLQSVEQPSVKEGFRAVFANKPVRMILLANLLNGFGVGNGQQDYFIDVMGAASLQTLINLPTSFIGSFSYGLVQPLRRRYSSKALWVFEDIYTRALPMIVFLLGLPRKNYQRKLYMSIVFGIWAFFDKWMFGIRKVIGAEIENESQDYCEWQNGYRVEATTSVAIGIVKKAQVIFMGLVRNLILGRIGYVQGRPVGTQSDHIKSWMFALCTGLPALSGVLAVIPKLMYPLSRELRAQMYRELHERRGEAARALTEAGAAAGSATQRHTKHRRACV